MSAAAMPTKNAGAIHRRFLIAQAVPAIFSRMISNRCSPEPRFHNDSPSLTLLPGQLISIIPRISLTQSF